MWHKITYTCPLYRDGEQLKYSATYKITDELVTYKQEFGPMSLHLLNQ